MTDTAPIAELRAALALATAFEIAPGIRVERRSGGLWCITDGRDCLNAAGEWETEPQPSNRTDAFIRRTRFTREEAFQRAKALL